MHPGIHKMATVCTNVKETVAFHKDVHSLYICGLLQQRESGELCDVSLTINGRGHRAHKAVLAASSPFFRSMFTSRMREESSFEIDLTESLPINDGDSFAAILDFMYTGDITVNIDNVEDALRISDFLLLDDVKEYCRQFLLVYGNLNPSNCLRISVVAEQHNITDLARVARDMMLARFHDHIIYSDEVLDVHVTVMQKLLSDQDVTRFTSTDQLVHLVLRWVNFFPEERSGLIGSLLSCLHLFSLSSDVLHMLGGHPLVKGHTDIMNRLGDIESSTTDTACSKTPFPVMKAEKISPPIEKHHCLGNQCDGEETLVAIAAIPSMKFFRLLVYRVAYKTWNEIPLRSEDILDSIPARLAVSALTVHADVAYILLTMNLPYPSHLLNINIVRINLADRQHSVHTFHHCLYQGALSCHTTLTDEQHAPPVILCCYGYICTIANQEGSGQLLVCDIENQTYTSYHIPGTRFISLARAVACEDRFVYIWCRHRFGHEEYCINKEVSFTIFDCKTMTFALDIPPPPGIGYADFAVARMLCDENGCVFLHTPAGPSLVFDRLCNDWITLTQKTPALSQRTEPEVPFPGREVWCNINSDIYILQNHAAYATSLSCLKPSASASVAHTPPPVDCITLASGCRLHKNVLDSLVACDRYDDSVTKLIHQRHVIEGDTEESETFYSSSSDNDNDYEYDEDIYGYFDDYGY